MTAESVDGVVETVGTFPVDLDRTRLRHDLDKFLVAYLKFMANTKKQQKLRSWLASKIQACTSELFDILEKPLDIELAEEIWAGLESVSTRELQLALKELYEAVSFHRSPATARNAWCVCYLAPIYERYFREEAKTSRPSHGGKPTGPFVRFVISVAKKNGIAMSPESIPPALARWRRGLVKNES
jgi:hypothetical protein